MKFNSHKVAVIGAGNVGSAVTYTMMIKKVAAEIQLIDVNEAKEAGEVMDIADGLCFVDTGCIRGADFKDARAADVIVLTAGARQQPGDTRLDLAGKNKAITQSIFKQIGKLAQHTIIVVVTNPVDVITHFVQRLTKLPPRQVFGTGTTLDTARLRAKLGQNFALSPQNVHGYVLGEHGDSEFVCWSSVTIGGVPANRLPGFTSADAKRIEAAVRQEAADIIERKGATCYGIGLVVANIVEAILYDQHLILPVTAQITDWNGVSGVCLGAPAVIGRDGVERHWPLPLTAAEKKKWQKSAQVVRGYL